MRSTLLCRSAWGPEGQEIQINANVFSEISHLLVMTFTQLYLKNWLRNRILEYFMLKIDGIKPEFAWETFVNFCVWRPLMSQNLTKNQKFPNYPKLVFA